MLTGEGGLVWLTPWENRFPEPVPHLAALPKDRERVVGRVVMEDNQAFTVLEPTRRRWMEMPPDAFDHDIVRLAP